MILSAAASLPVVKCSKIHAAHQCLPSLTYRNVKNKKFSYGVLLNIELVSNIEFTQNWTIIVLAFVMCRDIIKIGLLCV